MQDRDRNIRRYAACSLGLIGNQKALDSLVIALKDPCNGVKSSAARALGSIDSELAIDPLVEALNSVCHYTGEDAFNSLVKICGLNNEILLRAALNNHFGNIRCHLYQIFNRIDFNVAITVMSECLSDPDCLCLKGFGTIISRIETEQHFDAMIGLAIKGINHKNTKMRISIIKSLISEVLKDKFIELMNLTIVIGI